MARVTKTVTLSLPPEMDKKISALLKKEGRTRSELFREAIRRYKSRVKRLQEAESERKMNLKTK
jgi:predicted DNA-binding protein